MKGSDGVIRSGIVRTNCGVQERAVVKPAFVVPTGSDIFAMENRSIGEAAALNYSANQFKNKSSSGHRIASNNLLHFFDFYGFKLKKWMSINDRVVEILLKF